MREDAETALHPSCTAKMGTDEMSVLDPATMGVHGLQGLRVVDASSMPYVTNGNIYAPVMMLAERGADLVLGNTPLRRRARAVLPAPRAIRARDRTCPDARVDADADAAGGPVLPAASTVGQAVNQPAFAGAVLCQTCLISWYSARPDGPSSRPLPERP